MIFSKADIERLAKTHHLQVIKNLCADWLEMHREITRLTQHQSSRRSAGCGGISMDRRIYGMPFNLRDLLLVILFISLIRLIFKVIGRLDELQEIVTRTELAIMPWDRDTHPNRQGMTEASTIMAQLEKLINKKLANLATR